MILLVFLLLKKALSASSYGHFTGAKEFWSQCHILRFWESGGPSANDVDLEVDLKSTSGRPQVNLWYLPTHLTHLPQVDLKSTSGRLGSLPRRHRSQCLHMTNGTWPHWPEVQKVNTHTQNIEIVLLRPLPYAYAHVCAICLSLWLHNSPNICKSLIFPLIHLLACTFGGYEFLASAAKTVRRTGVVWE